jgi:hypothetical protein
MHKKFLVAAGLVSLSIAGKAGAEGEITFLFGASISGDISVLNDLDIDQVEAAVQNSPLFGLRLGTYGFPFGIEGSFIYSPSGLTGGALDDLVEANASILYTEANVLVIILPGPVQPFVTAVSGFTPATSPTCSADRQLGYNYGGGIKLSASPVSFRVDLKDHVTTFGFDDLGLGIIGDLIGLSNTESRLHNVELSFGLGIRF